MEELIDMSEFKLIPDIPQEHIKVKGTNNNMLKYTIFVIVVGTLIYISLKQYKIYINSKNNEKNSNLL